MKLNALFPTRDIGTDPAKIRDFAQAAEELGYHGIEVADHVFGAAPRGDWKPTYSEYDPFHETFTTMAFIAAVTKKVELASGVRELITSHGRKGYPAEDVADDALDELEDFLEAGVPVGECLADQLLLPLALAGGGKFRTLAPLSQHSLTNIATIREFVDTPIRVDPSGMVADVIVG